MLFESVTGLIGGGKTAETVHECRRCGTSVSPDTEECPNCGRGSEIVEHEIV